MDSLQRSTYQLVADIRPLEVDSALSQLADYVPPEDKNMLDIREIRSQALSFIRKELLICNITINFLIFELIVQVVPGKSINVFIRRKSDIKQTEPQEIFASQKM